MLNLFFYKLFDYVSETACKNQKRASVIRESCKMESES